MCVRCTRCRAKIVREDLYRDFYDGGVAHMSCAHPYPPARKETVEAYKKLREMQDKRRVRIRKRIPTRVRKPIGTRLGR